MKWLVPIIILAAVLLIAYIVGFSRAGRTSVPVVSVPGTPATSSTAPTAVTQPVFGLALPVSDALSRVTKKPFGIYITPATSPVQPERFTGYHTGTDFETTPDEQNSDVAVYAICEGKLLQSRTASGYGGLAVQACKINSQDVTVVYGHIRHTSVTAQVGDTLKAGQQLAVLGTGYSSETDGERKHLHLGIHKGTSIDILGYVQIQSELSGWLDPMSVLK